MSKVAKEANLGKFSKVYRYMYRGVPVHPTRMQHVPVHVQGVPVHVFPKCAECYVFVSLSPNSYTDSLGTLLND